MYGSVLCTYTSRFMNEYIQVCMCMVHRYGHSTDTSVQLHNHTSPPIRPDQPCDAFKSQLHTGSAPSEQPEPPSCHGLIWYVPCRCCSNMHVYKLHILCHMMYRHCIYKVILCIYMYIRCTWVLRIICIYNYGIHHCILACTSLVICMYYAIIQE
jgi:hypothetical protein